MDNKFKNQFESEAEEIMSSADPDFNNNLDERDSNINPADICDNTENDTADIYDTSADNENKNISGTEISDVKSQFENIASEALSSQKGNDTVSKNSGNRKSVIIIIAVIAIILAAVAAYFAGHSHSKDKDDKKSSSDYKISDEQTPNDPAAAGIDKDAPGYMPAEDAQIFKDYSDLTKDCFFNATAFTEYAGNGSYVLFTGTQVLDIMGEPERKDNWTYQGQGGDYEVTSYYYNIDGGENGGEPTLNFVFYKNTLIEIIVMEPVTFEGTDDLLAKFGLKTTSDSQVLIDNDEQFRVTNCGINNFWAYAIEYSKDKTRGDAYCYLRYLEL